MLLNRPVAQVSTLAKYCSQAAAICVLMLQTPRSAYGMTDHGCFRDTILLPTSVNDAGEKQGHSLLARDSPSLWYEAAAALPPLPLLTGAAAAATVTEADFEAKKQAALAALQNEETVFERDLGACLVSIYRHPACFIEHTRLNFCVLQHQQHVCMQHVLACFASHPSASNSIIKAG